MIAANASPPAAKVGAAMGMKVGAAMGITHPVGTVRDWTKGQEQKP